MSFFVLPTREVCECLSGVAKARGGFIQQHPAVIGTMEVSYGIGVTNRYALFLSDENEDPLEALKSEKEHSATTAAKKTEVPSKQDASSKSIKQVDLKGKDGKIGSNVAPATAAAKKGGPKETQPNAKSVEQIRTREGNTRVLTTFSRRYRLDLGAWVRQRAHHVDLTTL